MTRKRAEIKTRNSFKKSLKKHKIELMIFFILALFFIASVWLVLSYEPNEENNIQEDSGKWLFALDTPSEYVGGHSEYQTGYIPTLVIVDLDGNIVHKSAGVHTKENLLEHIENAQNSSNTRTKAPDFTLETLYGNKFTLSDYKGIPVVLDLMAVRCPPCKQQMPELQKVKKELGDEVVILSIDVDAAAGYENAKDVIEAFGEYIKEE